MPPLTRNDLLAILSSCIADAPSAMPWVAVLPDKAPACLAALVWEAIEQRGIRSCNGECFYLPVDAWNELLSKLVSELRAILTNEKIIRTAERGLPSDDKLTEEPRYLPLWLPIRMGPFGPCLAGLDGDHLRPGTPWITTSVLMAFDSAGGWARTHTGWYRLGRRLNWAQVQAIRGHGLSDVVREVTDIELKQALDQIRLDVQRDIEDLQRSRETVRAAAS